MAKHDAKHRGLKVPLEDLVAHGSQQDQRYLFVIDGAKALRAAIERAFGEHAEVQRCQWHKRRNVQEYLPKTRKVTTIGESATPTPCPAMRKPKPNYRKSFGNWGA